MTPAQAIMAIRAAEECGIEPSELTTAHIRLYLAGYFAGLTAAQYEADANAEAKAPDYDNLSNQF
jgi:hypothetical protein